MTATILSGRYPWDGETIAVPSRVTGRRVVAAVKLPTRTAPAHRWSVVLEDAGQTWTVASLAYVDGGFVTDRQVTGTDYPQALERMLTRYADAT